MLAFSLAMIPLKCPACHKTGLIRTERVIKGNDVATFFYCGGCTHSWLEPDATAARNSSDTLAPKNSARDRRRNP